MRLLNCGIDPAFPVKYWTVQDASAGSDFVLNEDWVFEYLQKEEKDISETTRVNALCNKNPAMLEKPFKGLANWPSHIAAQKVVLRPDENSFPEELIPS